MAGTFEAARGITAIDTHMAGRPGLTSAYLLEADQPALVETGPTTSVEAVRATLEGLGVGPSDLAHIVVTHIHLDHAGGAGGLAVHFPRATVWVHERGAPHLVDPAKLVASATRVYGERRMAELFGPVEPLPAERVRAVVDGDAISLGNRSLEVIYTPGHAGHQVALVDTETDGLFTGDALGVYLPEVRILRPATPPPEFDLELAVRSIERIRERAPSQLLFSHFGPAAQVAHLCALAVQRVRKWASIVQEALGETDDLARVTQILTERTAPEFNPRDGRTDLAERYEILSSVEMNASGLVRYLTRLAEAAAES
jgi:glyoxylase-like metal-dependent hydrolase (beta-lactamase superfamily II)